MPPEGRKSHHPPLQSVTAMAPLSHQAIPSTKPHVRERCHFPSRFGTQFPVGTRNNRIFELWMACYSTDEIAELCGVDKAEVSRLCSKTADLPNLNKLDQAQAETCNRLRSPHLQHLEAANEVGRQKRTPHSLPPAFCSLSWTNVASWLAMRPERH